LLIKSFHGNKELGKIMEESLQLRVGAIFLIFFASIIGSALPFVLIRNGVEDLSINGTFLIVKSICCRSYIGSRFTSSLC
jgi:hypothetical protein